MALKVNIENIGTSVTLHCPFPLVVKLVQRARELGGIEQLSPYGQTQPDRHTLYFNFADTSNGNIYYSEAISAITQWENENEPDEGI